MHDDTALITTLVLDVHGPHTYPQSCQFGESSSSLLIIVTVYTMPLEARKGGCLASPLRDYSANGSLTLTLTLTLKWLGSEARWG